MRLTLRGGVALALAITAFASVAPAAGAKTGLLLGVDDDMGRWLNPASSLRPMYRQLGVGAVRVSLDWTPGQTSLSDVNPIWLDRAMQGTPDVRPGLERPGYAKRLKRGQVILRQAGYTIK